MVYSLEALRLVKQGRVFRYKTPVTPNLLSIIRPTLPLIQSDTLRLSRKKVSIENMSRKLLLLLCIGSGAISSPLIAREVVISVAADATVVASSKPTEAPGIWDDGAIPDFPIHSSCNVSQARYLRNGLNEAIRVSSHARDHLLRWGDHSPFKVKYFGNASTAEPIGHYSRIVSADRGNMTFRCDDIDGNCNNPGIFQKLPLLCQVRF